MTLQELLEQTAKEAKWTDATYRNIKTAVQYLAQGLGTADPSSCYPSDYHRSLDELKDALNSTLTGKSPHTVRNNRNWISRLFRDATEAGVIKPFKLPTPQMTFKEAFKSTQFSSNLTQYRKHYDDWSPEIRSWWEQSVKDMSLRMRSPTINLYQRHLEFYLGYLEYASTPDDLYNIDNLKGFTLWHAQRRGTSGMTTTARAVCKALIAATFEEDRKEQVRELQKSRPAPPMHDKQQEVDALSLRELEAVGIQLINKGRKPVSTDIRAQRPGLKRSLSFQRGLMLRLLVRVPLRSRNLREMKLEQNLYRDRDGKWIIEFKGEELKVARRNGQLNVFRVDFPSDLVPILEEFLDDYRPLLAEQQQKHLFLTCYGNPFSPNALCQAIQATVYQYTQKRFYPHLIRTLWPTEMAQSNADIRAVAYMMNDRVETIWKAYYAHSGKGLQERATQTLNACLGQMELQTPKPNGNSASREEIEHLQEASPARTAPRAQS